MTTKTATKTTRTPRTRKGATIAAETEQGELVVIAETQHVELPAPVPAKPAKKLSNRELAAEAVTAWNEANGAQLVFRGHVKGNLLDAGEALFSVIDGDKVLRARIITVAGGGAEVSEVFDPTPSKADKAEEKVSE